MKCNYRAWQGQRQRGGFQADFRGILRRSVDFPVPDDFGSIIHHDDAGGDNRPGVGPQHWPADYNDSSRWDSPGCVQGEPALGVGAAGSLVATLRLPQPPQQFGRSEPVPEQHLPHHPVHLRAADPGHLFPARLAAGSAGSYRPAGGGARDDASLPWRGSRIHPSPHHSFPSGTPFQFAILTCPHMLNQSQGGMCIGLGAAMGLGVLQ